MTVIIPLSTSRPWPAVAFFTCLKMLKSLSLSSLSLTVECVRVVTRCEGGMLWRCSVIIRIRNPFQYIGDVSVFKDRYSTP